MVPFQATCVLFCGGNIYVVSIIDLKNTPRKFDGQWREVSCVQLLGIDESVQLGGDDCLASVRYESSRCQLVKKRGVT